MIKISPRLMSLTKYLFSEDKIMDVGCDHAILDIYLVQSGIVKNVCVCDVNPNALQNGIDNIEKYELSSNITPVLGYGIEKARDYGINTVVISGMGSKNIIEILGSPNLNLIYKLVLQSNNNHYELRKFITSKGFNIVSEEVIEDGKKTYVNIVAIREYNQDVYSEMELEFGPLLIQNKNNLDYFRSLLLNYEDILYASRNDEVRTKINMLEQIIANLEDK